MKVAEELRCSASLSNKVSRNTHFQLLNLLIIIVRTLQYCPVRAHNFV